MGLMMLMMMMMIMLMNMMLMMMMMMMMMMMRRPSSLRVRAKPRHLPYIYIYIYISTYINICIICPNTYIDMLQKKTRWAITTYARSNLGDGDLAGHVLCASKGLCCAAF